MNYKYIYENPSENRQLYMYSDYHGKEFIRAYKKSRNDVLIKCLKKINRTTEKIAAADKLLKLSNYDHIKRNEIMSIFGCILNDKFIVFEKQLINSDLTKTINDLSSLFNKAKNNKPLNKLKIDNLVKKFEIKKNFSTEIKNSFDKTLISIETDEMFHFLFTFVLSKYFISFNSFKYFNTLLKLNDFLIYRFYNMNFINIELLLCTISLELKIYLNLEEDILGV